MLAKDVIKQLGGSIAAASALGVSRATTCTWARKGRIPNKWLGKIRGLGIDVNLTVVETKSEAQKATIRWLNKFSTCVFFVKRLAGKRSKSATANFPVVFFPFAGKIGMFVVILASEGRIREGEANAVRILKSRGYRVEVARGSVEAINIVKTAFEEVSHV